MRQLVLDTETTGMPVEEGHRLIEIGCVELVSRRYTGNNFHEYINPEREIEEGATQVHGFTWADLVDKPLFKDVADQFVKYIEGSELIIHNAAFDVGFLDAELAALNNQLGEQRYGCIEDYCKVFDSLDFARRRHPGQRNSLDALCRRYEIDNTGRVLHGALLDAELLADVYLAMTGGQVKLLLGDEEDELNFEGSSLLANRRLVDPNLAQQLQVQLATPAEVEAHLAKLAVVTAKAGRLSDWQALEAGAAES